MMHKKLVSCFLSRNTLSLVDATKLLSSSCVFFQAVMQRKRARQSKYSDKEERNQHIPPPVVSHAGAEPFESSYTPKNTEDMSANMNI